MPETPEHVYILCYGTRATVRDRDYLVNNRAIDYPFTHHVGCGPANCRDGGHDEIQVDGRHGLV